MIGRGQAVKGRREALGLTREALSADTRVPVAHITSLEEGTLEQLPAGPYADAWLRTLEAHLGLPSPPPVATAPGAPRRQAGQTESSPMWLPRVVAGLAVGTLVAAIVWQAALSGGGENDVDPVATDASDQEVLVRALRNTRVRVVADGELVREGPMAGGDELEVRATERVELQVEAAGAVRIDYNGERIVPQGRQDEPRTLVFLDDGGSRP